VEIVKLTRLRQTDKQTNKQKLWQSGKLSSYGSLSISAPQKIVEQRAWIAYRTWNPSLPSDPTTVPSPPAEGIAHEAPPRLQQKQQPSPRIASKQGISLLARSRVSVCRAAPRCCCHSSCEKNSAPLPAAALAATHLAAKLADLASRRLEEFDPAYLETEEEKKRKTPTQGACC